MHPCFMQLSEHGILHRFRCHLGYCISCFSPWRRSELRAVSCRWSVRSTRGPAGPLYSSDFRAESALVSGTRARANKMKRCLHHTCSSSAPLIRRKRCGNGFSTALRNSGTAGQQLQAASLHLGGLRGWACSVVRAQSGNEVWPSRKNLFSQPREHSKAAGQISMTCRCSRTVLQTRDAPKALDGSTCTQCVMCLVLAKRRRGEGGKDISIKLHYTDGNVFVFHVISSQHLLLSEQVAPNHSDKAF